MLRCSQGLGSFLCLAHGCAQVNQQSSILLIFTSLHLQVVTNDAIAMSARQLVVINAKAGSAAGISQHRPCFDFFACIRSLLTLLPLNTFLPEAATQPPFLVAHSSFTWPSLSLFAASPHFCKENNQLCCHASYLQLPCGDMGAKSVCSNIFLFVACGMYVTTCVC